jgi:glycosyltransferase involved in cell wall biosynthesis
MKSFCLGLLVRNNAATLKRCLDSAAALCDSFVIVDFGSIDGSIPIVDSFLKTHRGRLYFSDLYEGSARKNFILDKCREFHTDHVIMMNPTEILAVLQRPVDINGHVRIYVRTAWKECMETRILDMSIPVSYHGWHFEYMLGVSTSIFLRGVCIYELSSEENLVDFIRSHRYKWNGYVPGIVHFMGTYINKGTRTLKYLAFLQLSSDEIQYVRSLCGSGLDNR